MKWLPFTVLLLLGACTEPVTREVPMAPNRTISLGSYALTGAARDFTPYFDLTTLIFADEQGVEYVFQMSQPIAQEDYSYVRAYPNPEPPGEFVEYRYSGEYIVFDFICNELGVRLSVTLESDFCEDPGLNSAVRPESQLQVRGFGFNDGDVGIPEPVLAVEPDYNRPCGPGRRLGDIELRGRPFTKVTADRLTLGDRYLEVYYSPVQGVVALETSYFFLVLVDAY